jgi:polyisoprenoid-binding protein YceI
MMMPLITVIFIIFWSMSPVSIQAQSNINPLAYPRMSYAQTSYTVDSNSRIDLSGTSTVRNWTMTAHSFTGSALMTLDDDRELSAISGFTLRLPVHNLKSDSRSTEKGAYKALKDDKYKDIVFELLSAQFKPSGERNYIVLLRGNLTIAGVTRITTLKLNATINDDQSMFCTGSLPVALSDYEISRPSFLLGTMKIGNVLTLSYSLLLIH